jgi:hypothetical protein
MIHNELFKLCSSIIVENENHINSGCFMKMNACSPQEMGDIPLSWACKWQLPKEHYEHLFKIYTLSNMGKQWM